MPRAPPPRFFERIARERPAHARHVLDARPLFDTLELIADTFYGSSSFYYDCGSPSSPITVYRPRTKRRVPPYQAPEPPSSAGNRRLDGAHSGYNARNRARFQAIIDVDLEIDALAPSPLCLGLQA